MGKFSKNIQDFIKDTLLPPAEVLQQLLSQDTYGEEDIHDIRVASRRLRIGLPIFNSYFNEKEYAKWMQDLKSLTTALGEARDHDVFINFLEENNAADELIRIEKARRDEAYRHTKKKIGKIAKGKTLEKIISRINEIYVLSENSYTIGLAHTIVRYSSIKNHSFSLDDADDIAGHHQMRISVKKFRYTLEVFAPLFSDELSDEITLMKNLQDSLGKMHDYDVFSEKISELARIAMFQGIDAMAMKEPLVGVCLEMRRKLHRKVCKTWMGIEGKEYINHLCAKFKNNHASSINSKKIMIVSDIHGNYSMLTAAVKDATCRGAEQILCLGDIAGKGDVEACLDFLKEKDAICIHGNYDVKTLEGQWGVRCFGNVASLKVSSTTADALVELPSEMRVVVNDKVVLMVHDSPEGGKERLHSKTNSKRLAYLGDISDADCVLMGHSHLPFIHKVNNTLFINPGSIGKPKDSDPRSSYALYDVMSGDAEIIKLDGDSSEIASRYKLSSSKSESERGIAEVYWGMEEVLKTAEEICVDMRHALTVARNVSTLFCCLTHLHNLQERDLELLQYAAILHDAGWLFGRKNHEKSSYKIIKDLELHLNPEEQEIVASVAKYHRGKMPEVSSVCNIPDASLLHILKLSALLRIADDVANNAPPNVQITDCTFVNGQIRIFFSEECCMQFKKDDLFEKVFGYSVEAA